MVSVGVCQLHSLCGGGWREERCSGFALIGSPSGSLAQRGLEVCAPLVLQCVLHFWSSSNPSVSCPFCFRCHAWSERFNVPSYPVDFVVTYIDVDNIFFLFIILSPFVNFALQINSSTQLTGRSHSISKLGVTQAYLLT